MKKVQLCLCLVACVVFGGVQSALSQECNEDTAVSARDVLEAVSEFCCSKNNATRCVRRQSSRLRSSKVRRWMGATVFTESRSALNALRSSGCNIDLVTAPECTDDNSTTLDEALASVRARACDLRFQSSRKAELKKLDRGVRRTGNALDPEFAAALDDVIDGLKTANNCGGGGEQNTLGCDRIVDPRDGANGNVWKRADHSCTGVFVTHDGARNGRIVTRDGQDRGPLNYTGLGNRDSQGLRHHYRTRTCCSSLPSFFYLDIGDTCYEINNRCGRID